MAIFAVKIDTQDRSIFRRSSFRVMDILHPCCCIEHLSQIRFIRDRGTNKKFVLNVIAHAPPNIKRFVAAMERMNTYRHTSDISRNISRQWTGCIWSITRRRYSNYIGILDLTPVFSGLGKDNRKQETFKVWKLSMSYIRGSVVHQIGLCVCKANHALNSVLV